MVAGSSPAFGAIIKIINVYTCIKVFSLLFILSFSLFMPITKSAKKALRSSTKKAEINAYMKVSMKNTTKVAIKSIKAKEQEAGELVITAQKRIDKAAKKNIVSRKSASRKISNLMKAAHAQWVLTTEKKVKKTAPVVKKEKKTTTKKTSK